jgi:hypothetical protein
MSKPLLTKTNLILRDRQGRDKLYKFIQYGLKILIEITKKFEYKLKNLNYVERIVKRLGQARSLFRCVAVLSLVLLIFRPRFSQHHRPYCDLHLYYSGHR